MNCTLKLNARRASHWEAGKETANEIKWIGVNWLCKNLDCGFCADLSIQKENKLQTGARARARVCMYVHMLWHMYGGLRPWSTPHLPHSLHRVACWMPSLPG